MHANHRWRGWVALGFFALAALTSACTPAADSAAAAAAANANANAGADADADANCAASFARDNAVKPEAGPYRTQIHQRVPLGEGAGARELDMHTTVEVVPPDRMRMLIQAGETASEVRQVGRQLWTRENGRWRAPVQAKADDDVRLTHYADARDLRALACLPAETWQGKAVRSYRYETPGRATWVQVVMRFDAQTGLPVAIATAAPALPQLPPAQSLYQFDRSLHIEPPRLD